MENLDNVRGRVVRLLLLFLWAHVPAALVHGWWAGSENVITITGLVMLMAITATLAVRYTSPPRVGRIILAVAMSLTAAALVALYEGHAWQKDAHLYFATIIALLSSTFCWRSLTTASVTTALYFLIVNAVAPQYLYGTKASFLEVGFEFLAFFVLTAGLLWVSQNVQALFSEVQSQHKLALDETEKAQQASSAAEISAEQAKVAAEAATKAQNEADQLRAEQLEQEALAAAQKRTMLEELAGSFEGSVQSIVNEVASMAGEMKTTASDLQSHAKAGRDSAERIAEATEGASQNVDSVSGATAELSSSTSEIAQQIDQTNTLTNEAVIQASDVKGHIENLSERAGEIGSVVASITEIAEQTNLLALNATIEAARAGEVGKGFAVVAAEVKNLAEQSAQAAEGIHDRISAVQKATEVAVTAMNSINDMITSINMGATAIAAAVEEQDAATRDIAASVQQASNGTRAAADDARAVENNARESESSTLSVLAATEELESLAATLGEETNGFLQKVRASA